MTRPFSIVALFLLGFNSAAASDATFLEAIAMVESGQNRKAIGNLRHWTRRRNGGL
mgnify:CR=1 FL=1